MVLGLEGQRSTLGLGLSTIRRGFELYECLLVVYIANVGLLTVDDDHAHNKSHNEINL